MSRGRVIFFPVRIDNGCRYTPVDAFMLTCISDLQGGTVVSVQKPERPAPTWVAVVHRFLKAVQRPDPDDPKKLKYWTQGDLAKAAGLRPNTLTDLMIGWRDDATDPRKDGPKIETLKAVARAFEIPVFYLLMTEEEAATYMQGSNVSTANQDRDAIRDEVVAALAPQIEDAIRAIADVRTEKRRKR